MQAIIYSLIFIRIFLTNKTEMCHLISCSYNPTEMNS